MSRWVCKTAVETFLRLCNKDHTFSNPIKLRRRIYGGLKSHNMNLIYLYCRQTTQSESLNISFVLGSKTICITRSKFCLNFVNMMNIFQIYFPPPPIQLLWCCCPFSHSSTAHVPREFVHWLHLYNPTGRIPTYSLFFMSFIFPDAIIQFPNSNH